MYLIICTATFWRLFISLYLFSFFRTCSDWRILIRWTFLVSWWWRRWWCRPWLAIPCTCRWLRHVCMRLILWRHIGSQWVFLWSGFAIGGRFRWFGGWTCQGWTGRIRRFCPWYIFLSGYDSVSWARVLTVLVVFFFGLCLNVTWYDDYIS